MPRRRPAPGHRRRGMRSNPAGVERTPRDAATVGAACEYYAGVMRETARGIYQRAHGARRSPSGVVAAGWAALPALCRDVVAVKFVYYVATKQLYRPGWRQQVFIGHSHAPHGFESLQRLLERYAAAFEAWAAAEGAFAARPEIAAEASLRLGTDRARRVDAALARTEQTATALLAMTTADPTAFGLDVAPLARDVAHVKNAVAALADALGAAALGREIGNIEAATLPALGRHVRAARDRARVGARFGQRRRVYPT